MIPDAGSPARCDNPEHCITCGDEGIVMRVTGTGDGGEASCVGEDGSRASVAVDLLEGVAPGDTILVHAGVALALVEAAG